MNELLEKPFDPIERQGFFKTTESIRFKIVDKIMRNINLKTPMKTILIISFMMLQGILTNSYAQITDPINNYKDYIENEEVISENKLPAHASFTSFTSKDKALSNHAEYFKSLDGVWKFN